ncbi:hypothetical protein J6590_094765 [Homalodisca vitripennis]|nr:hypothetical protein J6590_094765 [Homalodisca vitripennis]
MDVDCSVTEASCMNTTVLQRLQARTWTAELQSFQARTWATVSQRLQTWTANMGWCLNNVEGFIDRFEEGIQEWRELNESMTVEKLLRICVDTCIMTLRKKILKGKRKPVYWWNEELTRLRKDCIKARRQVTRGNRLNLDLHDRETWLVTYREKRNNFKKAIFEAKNRAWKEV